MISVVVASHRGTSGVVLVYHKVICTKSLTVVNNIFFSYKMEKMGSVKFLLLKIGPDIDLVCPTSSFFTNIVMTSNWISAIRRPCSIQSGRAKLLSARICACRLFRHPALTKIKSLNPPAQIWGSLEFVVRSLALCCLCHPQTKTPLVCYFHCVLL